MLDHAAVAKAIGAAAGQPASGADPVELPEPLASVVDYLGEDLDQDGREFVPTAELAEALGIESTELAREMGDLDCRPTRHRTSIDGEIRRVRGYLVADIRAAVKRVERGETSSDSSRETDRP